MKKPICKGIGLMLLSAGCTCVGQLCWKLSVMQRPLLFIMIGFFLYACGAILMIYALRFGELSVLHPVLSVGYIFSIVLSGTVLRETITWTKLLGTCVIILGLVVLNLPGKGKRC